MEQVLGIVRARFDQLKAHILLDPVLQFVSIAVRIFNLYCENKILAKINRPSTFQSSFFRKPISLLQVFSKFTFRARGQDETGYDDRKWVLMPVVPPGSNGNENSGRFLHHITMCQQVVFIATRGLILLWSHVLREYLLRPNTRPHLLLVE